MTTRGRTELIQPADTVSLTATFKDGMNVPTDTDIYPNVTIVQPDGLVSVGATSVGVSRISVGKYQFDFTLSLAGPYGVFNDIWNASLNGFPVSATFSFVCVPGDVQAPQSDGYLSLGDDVGFDYSQDEIFNINKLLKGVKARLNSSGKSKSTDKYGNVTYISCDIFSVESLTSLLSMSLTEWNETPHITGFSFADSNFVNQFYNSLVEGAVLLAMASQALLERGAEYTITDNGVNFQPSAMSELLNTAYSQLLTHHWDRIKMIKNTFKPFPMGLGSFSMTGGQNPTIRNLAKRRERQIF